MNQTLHRLAQLLRDEVWSGIVTEEIMVKSPEHPPASGVTELRAIYSRTQFARSCRVGPVESQLVLPQESELPPHLKVRVSVVFREALREFSVLGDVAYSVVDLSPAHQSSVVVSVAGHDLGFCSALAFARGLPIELGRRRHPRLDLWQPAQYTSRGVDRRGYLSDVSVEGGRVETWNERPPLGEVTVLHLLGGDEERPPLHLPAVVVSIGFQNGVPRFGLRFGVLGTETEERLGGLVERLAAEARGLTQLRN